MHTRTISWRARVGEDWAGVLLGRRARQVRVCGVRISWRLLWVSKKALEGKSFVLFDVLLTSAAPVLNLDFVHAAVCSCGRAVRAGR